MTFDWQGANETDVREELLCHLLRRLGYKRNSANQILTEHHVFYDRATLGRKKVNDPKMMGKIDYLLKVGGSARWVLEAKAPKTLTQQDIDQVLTYARHPEVAAVYAAICNGKEFRLYSSNQMSDEQPLLQFDVVSIQDAEERLSATLHPDCINRDFALKPVSQLRPISKGRGSKERIEGGFMRHLWVRWEALVDIDDRTRDQLAETFRRLEGFNIDILGGTIERDPIGRIVGYYDWSAPHASLSDFNERKGILRRPIYCLDDEISQDPGSPTVFDSVLEIEVLKGEAVFDFMNWNESTSEHDLVLRAGGQSVGYLDQNIFLGFFDGAYDVAASKDEPPLLRYWSSGTFEVYLKD